MRKFLSLVIVICILLSFSSCGEVHQDNKPSTSVPTDQPTEPPLTLPSTDATKVPPTEELTEPPTDPPIGTKENPYSEGMYKVGVDLPVGEYLLFAAGSSGYYCVSSDSNQDDIIENGIFNGHSFVTVEDGQYFDVSRCTFLIASDYVIGPNDDGSFSDGMYRVGIDIPAGEYHLTVSDDRGYYAIYNSSKVPLDIVSNNIFEKNTYVTVTEGQYIEISRCVAEPTFLSVDNSAYLSDSLLSAIESTLNYNNLTVTAENGVIFVKYWSDGVSAAVDLVKSGDPDKTVLWNKLISSEIKQCTIVMDALSSLNADYSVSWNILDDIDTSKVLLTIVDGEVTFNAAE